MLDRMIQGMPTFVIKLMKAFLVSSLKLNVLLRITPIPIIKVMTPIEWKTRLMVTLHSSSSSSTANDARCRIYHAGKGQTDF